MPSKVASSRKDFERLEKVIKNIAKSVNTLQTSNKKLGGGVDELTQKFKKQENQQKKNGQKTRILTGAFAKLRAQMLIAAFAIGIVNKALFTQIKRAIQTEGRFEALRTRLVSLKGSVDKANKSFAVLNQVAATTPFTLERVVEAGASLEAFGLTAEKNIKITADLAAFMGVDVVEAAAALGRAFAGGAGAADVLRDRGILQLVKSFKGIDDLKSTTLPEFRKALIETLQAPTVGIVGSTDKLSKTYIGAVSNMQDSVSRLNAAIGRHFMPMAKAFVGGIASMSDAAREFVGGETFEEAIASQVIELPKKKLQELKAELLATEHGVVSLGREYGKSMFVATERTGETELKIKRLNYQIDLLEDKLIQMRGGGEGEDFLISGLQRNKDFIENEGFKWVDGVMVMYRKLIESEHNYTQESEDILTDFYTKRHIDRVGAIEIERAQVIAAAMDRIDNEKDRLQAIDEINEFYDQKKADRDKKAFEAALSSHKLLLTSFSDMTSAMSTKVNTRMQNEIDALKSTEKYENASAERRATMEHKITEKYAKDRERVAKFEKASNIAQAGINIATAISDALPNLYLAGLVATMGAIQLHAIMSTPLPKFQRGGYIGGKRHSQGGTMIEAEQGEFVMSRNAVKSVGIEAMNRINQGGVAGGITVNVSGNVMTQDFVETDLAEAIRQAARRGTDFGVS